MSFAVGVDLGTTYTAAGLFTHGRAEVVPLGAHGGAVPSVVYVDDDGLSFGDVAVQHGEVQPARLVREFKRRLGEEAPIVVGDRSVGAESLMGELARWAVHRTAELQGGAPAQLVVTCPANWGPYRRRSIAKAVGDALGERMQCTLLSEPEAAAVYYATQDRLHVGATVAVYDLGGGTFDAAILRKTDGAFELVGPARGVDDIGGVDVDRLLFDHVLRVLDLPLGQLDRSDLTIARQVAALRASVTHAKELLSEAQHTELAVNLGPVVTSVRVTRRELEEIAAPLLEQTVRTFDDAIAAAGLRHADLHSVLLVGGASRMPLVSRLLTERAAVRLAIDTHPKFAVCLGAAIVAASQMTGTVVERALERDDLPPTVPVSQAGRAALADALVITSVPPPPLADPVDDLPPLEPASRVRTFDRPVIEPSDPIEPADPIDGTGAPVPRAEPATSEDEEPALLWEHERVVATIDLAGAGLLGLADVPVTPVSRVRVDEGRRLQQADVMVIGGTGPDRRRLVVVGVVLLVLVVAVVAVVVVASRSDTSRPPSVSGAAAPGYPIRGGS